MEKKIDRGLDVVGGFVLALIMLIGVIQLGDFYAAEPTCPAANGERLVTQHNLKDGSIVCSYIKDTTGLAKTQRQIRG